MKREEISLYKDPDICGWSVIFLNRLQIIMEFNIFLKYEWMRNLVVFILKKNSFTLLLLLLLSFSTFWGQRHDFVSPMCLVLVMVKQWVKEPSKMQPKVRYILFSLYSACDSHPSEKEENQTYNFMCVWCNRSWW